MERGILVVSFGTTYQETREKNIDQMVALVREQYPHDLVEEHCEECVKRAGRHHER